MSEPIKKLEFNEWVFDCPVHGLNSRVFCWRAFSEELKMNWHKCKVVWDDVPTSEAEIDGHLARMRKNYQT